MITFHQLVAEESVRLQRLAWGLTGNRSDAEDLVQDALMQAYRRWHQVSAAEHPRAYVRRVLINLHHRRRFLPEVLVDEMPDRGTTDDISDHLVRRALLRGLASLSEQQRHVVALRYLDDQSVVATAEILGCSQATVTTQSSRGLARLRQIPELRTILEENPCPI